MDEEYEKAALQTFGIGVMVLILTTAIVPNLIWPPLAKLFGDNGGLSGTVTFLTCGAFVAWWFEGAPSKKIYKYLSSRSS
tara:strand:- start:970 stop:1209 length:240 start_codon:yes stop_codon:yes gene_type:complete